MTSRIIAAGVLPLATVCCSMSYLVVLGVLFSSVSLSVSAGDETGESASFPSSTWSSDMVEKGYKNGVGTTTESISQEPNILSLEERQDDLTPRSAEAKDPRHLNGQETTETSASQRDHHRTPPKKEKGERRSPTRLFQWRLSSHKRLPEDKTSPYAQISMFLQTSAWVSTALLLFCYLRAIQVICSQATNTNTLKVATPHTGLTSRLLSETQHPADICTVVRDATPSYRANRSSSSPPARPSHERRHRPPSLHNTNRRPSLLPSRRSPPYLHTSPPPLSGDSPHLSGHQGGDLPSSPPPYDALPPFPPTYEAHNFASVYDHSDPLPFSGVTDLSDQDSRNSGLDDELPPAYSQVPPPYTEPYAPPSYEEAVVHPILLSPDALVYERLHPSHSSRRRNVRALYVAFLVGFLFVAFTAVYSCLLIRFAMQRDEARKAVSPSLFSLEEYELQQTKLRPPHTNQSTTTGVPSTTTGVPSTTTGVQSTTTGVPSTTTGVPSTTTGVPSTTTGVQSTTTGVPSTTTGVPSTTTGVPSTTTGVPSTTAGVPSTTTGVQSTTTGVQSTTTGVPSTTTGVPSTTTGVQSTTTGVPSTTTGVPSTTTGVPSTTAGVQSTTTGVQSTTTGVQSTTTGVPSTSIEPTPTGVDSTPIGVKDNGTGSTATPVYTFSSNFFTSGELPENASSSTQDKIEKFSPTNGETKPLVRSKRGSLPLGLWSVLRMVKKLLAEALTDGMKRLNETLHQIAKGRVA